MKIERTNRPTAIPVREVHQGEVFESRDNFYMMLAGIGSGKDEVIYAIDLDAARLTKFPPDEPVIPWPDARVVL